MIQIADIGVRMIRHNLWTKGEGGEKKEENQADFVVSEFRQLPSLIFNHGYNSYIQTSKMIVYYMYKNMILVFCEMWFATVCGYSGMRYWTGILITLYNSLLTTFQCFVALNYEAANKDPNNPMVSPIVYKINNSATHANAIVFFQWTLNSFFHGSMIYFLVTMSYTGAVDADGHVVDFRTCANISYVMIIHIVNLKLFLELNVRNKFAIQLASFTVFLTYNILAILSLSIFSSLIDSHIYHQFFMMFTTKGLLLMFTASLIPLGPDMMFWGYRELRKAYRGELDV